MYDALCSPEGSSAQEGFIETVWSKLAKLGIKAKPAEKKSWARSLFILADDLVAAGLGEVEVLVEHPMPGQPRSRADAVLAGIDPYTRAAKFVVVELKQWDTPKPYEGDPAMVEWDSRYPPREHPALQVRSYQEKLKESYSVLEGELAEIRSVVYLHNATKEQIAPLVDFAVAENVEMFTQTDRSSFRSYLRGHFAAEPGTSAAEQFLDSQIRPSRQLLDKARDVLRNRDQFILLDRQQEAFRAVLHDVEQARRANSKRVIIVRGGAGTGKSAIAISLVEHFAGKERPIVYTTGSRAFTETLRRRVAGTKLKGLFKYFNEYAQAEENDLEVLIADEAHRARSKSFDRYRESWRSDRPQIESLIQAARVPVFLLDEHQVVRPDEVGTVAAIKAHAQKLNLKYRCIDLDGQWRCGGSPAYDQWVRRLLGLGDEDSQWDGDAVAQRWAGDKNFQVILAASPREMENLLLEKIEAGCSARMTAGFCWPWSPPNPDNSLEPDVSIGDWARPWNAKSGGLTKVGDAPPSQLWATADGGFEQIGCAYTAQGLEFDWAGVIIGPDLIVQNDSMITAREGNQDPELSKASDEEFDRLVRNTYRVLLTRGLEGIVIYATDPATQAFLTQLIETQEGNSPRDLS